MYKDNFSFNELANRDCEQLLFNVGIKVAEVKLKPCPKRAKMLHYKASSRRRSSLKPSKNTHLQLIYRLQKYWAAAANKLLISQPLQNNKR